MKSYKRRRELWLAKIDSDVSQALVARKTKINESILSGIFSGRVNPSTTEMERLAIFFNSTPSDLFPEELTA